MATKTDSKNNSASRGRMAGKTNPRSRRTEKAIKFNGSRKATASRAIRPLPVEAIRPEEKNSRARWPRKIVESANRMRLEWKRQASRMPAANTA